MRRAWRGRVGVAALALLASVGAACGSSAPAPRAVVNVFGSWRGDEAARFAAAMAPFEARTGIDVRYVGTGNLARDLAARLEAGSRPDVVFLPQPGVLADLVADDAVVPLSGAVADAVRDAYDPAWLDLVGFDGKLYGVPWSADVKSLVWYSPRVLADAGLEVPTTFEELQEVSRRLAAVDGGPAPWCVGMESFGSTGWVATDWIEHLLLTAAGPDVYDDWVAHRIPFDAPAVLAATRRFTSIALDNDLVLGSSVNWLTVAVSDAIAPLAEQPPRCALHRQASFARQWLPDDVSVAPDGDLWVFPFPPVGDPDVRDVVVSGDLAVPFRSGSDVDALLEYLTDPRSGASWAAAGGWLPAHDDREVLDYDRPLDRELVRIVEDADVLRFDGSDLMPAAVGTGTFWSGMVDLLAGHPARDVLTDIDASWPARP